MTVDTLDYVRKLEAAGVDRRQAEAHAQALRNAVETGLATKADLTQAIATLGSEIGAEMRALRNELKGDNETLRSDLRGEAATLRSEMAAVRSEIDTSFHSFEAALWKHTVGVLLGVLAVGGLLIRFLR